MDSRSRSTVKVTQVSPRLCVGPFLVTAFRIQSRDGYVRSGDFEVNGTTFSLSTVSFFSAPVRVVFVVVLVFWLVFAFRIFTVRALGLPNTVWLRPGVVSVGLVLSLSREVCPSRATVVGISLVVCSPYVGGWTGHDCAEGDGFFCVLARVVLEPIFAEVADWELVTQVPNI